MSGQVHIKGTADMQGVVQGAAQADKAIRGIGKASGRRGGAAMGILEASRAIEDFTMAGMRGAVNNIPGLIMSLGGGMGLAGAASVAMVAMWKLTEAFEAFLNKQRDAKQLKMGEGLGITVANLEFTKEELRQIKTAAEEAAKAISGTLERREAFAGASQDSAKRRLEAAKQVENERELLNLKKQGAKDDEIEMTRLRQKAEALKREVSYGREAAEAGKQRVASLEAERDAQDKVIKEGIAAQEELKSWADEQRAALAEAARVNRMRGAKGPEGPEFAEAYRQGRGMTAEIERQLRERVRLMEIARQTQKMLTEEITEEEAKVRIAEINRRAKEAEIEAQAKLNQLKAEELKLERQKALEESRKEMVQALSTDSSGLLSSAARMGLGATEALNSLNIQKNMLNVLKSIDRSMKGKLAAYAAA